MAKKQVKKQAKVVKVSAGYGLIDKDSYNSASFTLDDATFYKNLAEANKNASEDDCLIEVRFKLVGIYKTQLVMK